VEANMQKIIDLKISGLDDSRPPKMSAAPYIELFFKLSEQAPLEWCQSFNLIFDKYQYSTRIDINKGLVIDTWVRKIEEIPAHFEMIKLKIIECNEKYNQQQAAAALALLGKVEDMSLAQGEQAKLNAMLATLNYD
jgi:hypothetical protein